MHNWFECKVSYEKTMENGMQKYLQNMRINNHYQEQKDIISAQFVINILMMFLHQILAQQ